MLDVDGVAAGPPGGLGLVQHVSVGNPEWNQVEMRRTGPALVAGFQTVGPPALSVADEMPGKPDGPDIEVFVWGCHWGTRSDWG